MRSVHRITAGTPEMAVIGQGGVAKPDYLALAQMNRKARAALKGSRTDIVLPQALDGRSRARLIWEKWKAGRLPAESVQAVRNDPKNRVWFDEFERGT